MFIGHKILFTLHDINCHTLLPYSPTPVQEIVNPIFEKARVRVLVKREDLNHPYVSGNKWWKLKYNLEKALRLQHTTLLTFGGAYSNHIYATASAAHALGLKSIGIIRGEEALPLNQTLVFVKSIGMHIHYISRESFRKKTDAEFIKQLHHQFGEFYLMPEGGTNALAVKGVTEFAQTLGNNFDYVCCAVGTGGTLAGLIHGLNKQKKILGFPVLKGGEFLQQEIEWQLSDKYDTWELITDYHFGGYAKENTVLHSFMNRFTADNNIPVEHVYTGKLFFGVYDLIAKGYFKEGSTILVIHTGGIRVR